VLFVLGWGLGFWCGCGLGVFGFVRLGFWGACGGVMVAVWVRVGGWFFWLFFYYFFFLGLVFWFFGCLFIFFFFRFFCLAKHSVLF
ncbi:hypothetical protein RA263_27970, partial [Pseudomonas syringae pv. tagetis]|uniref:hypothetical protein n=1 Tax=Pseudomonas syringae group genomosp. 7 TaxID=251699 RepID=UPI00376F9B42